MNNIASINLWKAILKQNEGGKYSKIQVIDSISDSSVNGFVFSRLKNLIPDLEHSLKMIIMLQSKQNTTEDIETQFLLADQVYLKASVPPTNQVCLWLGVSFTEYQQF